MDLRLSDRQRELKDKARRLAREVLAKNAAAHDRDSSHPLEDYAALRDQGFYGMLIPAEYGGWGLDLLTYCLVMHELAQGAVATATAFNMHNFVMYNIGALGTHEQKTHWFGKVLSEGALIGGWGSEPGGSLSAGGFAVGTTITPDEDGYLVSGKKFFCTLAGVSRYAQLMVVPADRVANMTMSDLSAVIVPASDPGVTIGTDWDVLGMRATVSPAVSFDHVFVRGADLIGGAGQNMFTRGLTQAIYVGYAGLYSGLARSALEFATDYAARKVIGPGGARHGQQPFIQQRIGELATMVDAAYALALKAGWELDQDYAAAAGRQTGARARVVAMRAVLEVTSRALELCGGTTVSRRFPLERYFREARTQTLMSPGYDALAGMIGKVAVDDAVSAQAKA